MLLIPCLTALHPSSHPRAGRVPPHTRTHKRARTHPSNELRGIGQIGDLDGPWFASWKPASSGGGRQGKRLTYKINSRPILPVGSDNMPTVRLEAELCIRAEEALQAGPQCSSADPDPKEPCLSRSVKVTLSPLLCARLDILSKWTRIYPQVFS